MGHPHHRHLSAEARAKITALRGQLREALAAKKRRLREITDAIRAERRALRERLAENHKRHVEELRAWERSERLAARQLWKKKRLEAKQEATGAIDRIRAELVAEQAHEAAQRKITREAQARARAQAGRRQSDDEVRALIPPELVPFFERLKKAIKGGPSQSRAEAFLEAATNRAEELFTIVEPRLAQMIADALTELARTERVARSSKKPGAPSRTKRTRAPARKAAGPLITDPVVRLNGQDDDGREFHGTFDSVARAQAHVPANASDWAMSDVYQGAVRVLDSSDSSPCRARPRPANSNALTAGGPSPAEADRVRAIQKRADAKEKMVKAPELRDTVEIAKRIREDIKLAVKKRELPKAKYNVRTDKYSMGSSIDVIASDLPFPVLNPDAFIVRKGESWTSFDNAKYESRLTPRAHEVERKLNALVDAYHWDRSDMMTDYHHERFGKDIRLTEKKGDWERIEKAKIAAAKAEEGRA